MRELKGLEQDWCLHDNAGIPYGRWMRPEDEAGFQVLLRRIYGNTYSYKDYYRPGSYAEQLRSGALEAFGMFSRDGSLMGHTAFIKKDPRGEYTESAMSLRPLTKELTREKESACWEFLMENRAARYAFVHQNTTTLHKLAQRYAMKHMRAVFAGFIYSYAEHETVAGVPDAAPVMHSLSMTTNLNPSQSGAEPVLPDDEWGRWLADIYRGIVPQGATRFAQTQPASNAPGFRLMEDNTALSLRRYVVKANGGEGRFDARINLVHLPCDDSPTLHEYFLENGFLPVGLRVHRARPSEIIMQKFSEPGRDIVAKLASARIYNEHDGEMLARWSRLCRKIS